VAQEAVAWQICLKAVTKIPRVFQDIKEVWSTKMENQSSQGLSSSIIPTHIEIFSNTNSSSSISSLDNLLDRIINHKS